MHFRGLVLSALIAVTGSTVSNAGTLSFTFSFTDTANSAGAVVGLIGGVQDNATGSARTVSVVKASFGRGRYSVPMDGAFTNTFTVVNGTITAYSFLSYGLFNAPPLETCCTLSFTNTDGPVPGNIYAGLAKSPAGVRVPMVSDFVIAPRLAAVPLPASGVVLAGGIAVLAAVARSRRRNRVQTNLQRHS